MTLASHRRLANTALWVAVGACLGNISIDGAAGLYHLAGIQCVLTAGLLLALWGSASLERLFEARLTKARADADLARFTYETVVQQMKAGRVQLDVGLSPAMKH